MAANAQPTPFSAFNFSVEIRVPGLSSGSICDAAFAECDGLEMSLDVKTIREGSNNGRQIKLAGPFTFGQLTLKRGMTSSFDLWDWFQKVAEDPTLRADGHVVIFGVDGKEKARFALSRCIPLKIKAPALNAKEGPIAIEEMQIAYESLAFERPSSTPQAASRLAKAQLIQVDQDGNELADGKMDVQFNPETLKVSFANQIQTPEGAGAGDQKGSAARQFVGAGTTKLAVQLVFDVTGEQNGTSETDVRKLTTKVAFFITPKDNGSDKKNLIPPLVRFAWGSFQFDGIMDSMEESLEFFSADGVPLRASVSFGLTQQKILPYAFRPVAPPPPGTGGAPVGTQPLDQAPDGATVQGMAAARGQGDNWRAIASANDIENPRQLGAGQLINFNVSIQGS
jgi:phage tail-like protein